MRIIFALALACLLVGCGAPMRMETNPIQKSEYPNNPVMPTDFMSLVL